MKSKVIECLKKAIKELIEKYDDKVIALGIFGSITRDEATEKSDVDIIVVLTNWERSMERRFKIYDILWKYIKRDITLIDVDYEVMKGILEGKINLTITMLNILYDCTVIYDKFGILNQLVREVKKYIEKEKLSRYRVGRAYGWKRERRNVYDQT